jgi:hypothetical protein
VGKLNLAEITFGLQVRSFASMPLVLGKIQTMNLDSMTADYTLSEIDLIRTFSARLAPFLDSSKDLAS